MKTSQPCSGLLVLSLCLTLIFSCDISIHFGFIEDSTSMGDGILLEYFENGSETATRSKILRPEE
jgi:hypothetical protein